MPRLALATIAVPVPMGAQRYDVELAARAAGALARTGRPWEVRRVVVRSMRSPLVGTSRLPLGTLARSPAAFRRAVGRAAYPGADLVHRAGLELPPARHETVTLHDVVAWRFPDESAPVTAAAAELRRAAGVICVSEFTASEAAHLLGLHDVHVVHNGVDGAFLRARPLGDRELRALGVQAPFVLHAGGAARRKNLPALAQAWRMVYGARPDVQLVLAGPPHPSRTELFQPLPGTRLLGRLPDELVPGLVASAAAVVVPSTYEGFGLPALEAMAAGVPVVASRRSALPEVVGDAGILVEPTGPALAEGLVWALSGDAQVRSLAERGRSRAAAFTWEASAAGHAAVWSRLV